SGDWSSDVCSSDLAETPGWSRACRAANSPGQRAVRPRALVRPHDARTPDSSGPPRSCRCADEVMTGWVEFPFERCVELVNARHWSSDLERATACSIGPQVYAKIEILLV